MASGSYRNLDNQEYWQKRSEEIANAKWNNTAKFEKELQKQYLVALDDIKRMVADLYTKYGDENGLTYAEAQKRLTQTEISNLQTRLDSLKQRITKTNDAALIGEYNRITTRMELTRLQSLLAEVEIRLGELAYTEQLTLFDQLSDTFATTQKETLYMIAHGTGIGVTFARLNDDAIREAITYPWSGDMFSDKIWSNRQVLVRNMRQTLIQGLIKGTSVQKMARTLNEAMNNGYKNSLRVVRTETAYVLGEATAKGYEKSNVVRQYEYMATLDSRTSSKCATLDGNVYKLEDKQVGVNFPPLHPNCRSTVTPYFKGIDEDSIGRIAKESDGTTTYVPPAMKYKEWEQKYMK